MRASRGESPGDDAARRGAARSGSSPSRRTAPRASAARRGCVDACRSAAASTSDGARRAWPSRCVERGHAQHARRRRCPRPARTGSRRRWRAARRRRRRRPHARGRRPAGPSSVTWVRQGQPRASATRKGTRAAVAGPAARCPAAPGRAADRARRRRRSATPSPPGANSRRRRWCDAHGRAPQPRASSVRRNGSASASQPTVSASVRSARHARAAASTAAALRRADAGPAPGRSRRSTLSTRRT